MQATPMDVEIHTTSYRGRTPDEIAEFCLRKIINIANDAPEPIKSQAVAFREALRPLLVYYMQQAINSNKTTLYNQLRDAGHADVAELILKL